MHIRSPLTTSAFAGPQVPGWRHVLQRALAAAAAHRQRQALSKLDDHLLSDIGLTRAEAEAEATHGIWNAPLHWRG